MSHSIMNKHNVSALVVGLVFGWGLILAGMTDPGKVKAFLDLAGAWDPSLAFVMGGAIALGLVAFGIAKRRTVNFLGGVFHWPQKSDIDPRLIGGSLLFGVGWGLGGYCPGPAWVSMASGQQEALYFVAAMLSGMLIFQISQRMRDLGRQQEPAA